MCVDCSPVTYTLYRDFGSSRDLGVTSRSSYDIPRDTLTSSRDPYSRRDDFMTSSSRDYLTSSRDTSRDYITTR